MIHRVVPFFIERAAQINQDVGLHLTRAPVVRRANLPLFLTFTVFWLLWPGSWFQSVAAWTLAGLNGYVLMKWTRSEVFRSPLLWSLWGGYAWIVLGFFLAGFINQSQVTWTAIHAFGAGAIGLTTLGMMARVTLGHTGRNVYAPDSLVAGSLSMVLIAALLRVLGPLGLLPGSPSSLYIASLIFWILGFGVFFIAYLRYWLKPRADGVYG